MSTSETRPVLFLTFADADTDSMCVDVSGSLEEAQRSAPLGYTYRAERGPDGVYETDELVLINGRPVQPS